MNNSRAQLVFNIILLPFLVFASNDGNLNKLTQTNNNRHFSKFNINNISTFIYNDGDADIRPEGNSGFEYPKGTNKAAVFESGFVWGGKINGKVLVGGSTYEQGLQPGRILSNGRGEDPNSESVRVFRVRPDYKTADLSSEIEDELKSESEIRSQYEKDWNEWPAHRGAPFADLDNNNIYNPQIDIPGIPGAHQTLWYVANDLDSNLTKRLYGSPTMGIELQVTIWGYVSKQILNNMIFKKYILINKSQNDFEDTYISIWSDPDLGDAGDDYVGCDTLLNMGYAYNGDEDDGVYDTNPPAVGFKLLQGPIVNGSFGDQARFNGKIINGKINLEMTSFPWFGKNGLEYNDPDLGDYEKGTLHYYNAMQGIGSSYGNPTINPITGEPDIFVFSGDPVTGAGWVQSLNSVPRDVRMGLNSGPFTMAPGDTQEVVIAQIIAGADENTDRLEAVKLLKNFNSIAQEAYDYNFSLANFNNTSISNVEVIELDQEIILTWYNDENLDNIEHSQFLNYNFEGYVIYQYPKQDFNHSEALPVGVFDINNNITTIDANYDLNLKEIKGINSGLQRHISITKNLFNEERPINNGTEYYFSLATYSVNKNYEAYPKMLESVPIKFSAIPQSPKPGNFYEGTYGQKIDLKNSIGQSNIPINIKIVDPTKLKDKSYAILFNINHQLPDSNLERIELTVMDNEGNTLYERNTITLKDKLGIAKSIIIDGFEIEPFDVKDFKWNPLLIEDGDEFIFSTPKAVLGDFQLAKNQVEKINVFPNPYYGKHDNESNQYQKFVTFNHLPPKANIKIFNLGGQLVNTIEKNDQSQFIKWDLTNGKNFWIPSGVYIVYIEMPELNKTKILKLAVIMANIVPDHF